jgi:hypothetical protein
MKWLTNKDAVLYGCAASFIVVVSIFSGEGVSGNIRNIWCLLLSIFCVVLIGKILFRKCSVLSLGRFLAASTLYFLVMTFVLIFIKSLGDWESTGKTRVAEILVKGAELAREERVVGKSEVIKIGDREMPFFVHENVIVGYDYDKGVVVIIEKKDDKGGLGCIVFPERYSLHVCQ